MDPLWQFGVGAVEGFLAGTSESRLHTQCFTACHFCPVTWGAQVGLEPTHSIAAMSMSGGRAAELCLSRLKFAAVAVHIAQHSTTKQSYSESRIPVTQHAFLICLNSLNTSFSSMEHSA